MNKINILKLVDRGVSPLLCRLLERLPLRAQCGKPFPQKILVIRPGGIGDAIHLIPMLRHLADQWPSSTIAILAEHRNAAAFGLCPQITRIYCYDRIADLARVLQDKFDLVIDTEQWHSLSAIVARMTRAARLIGFATNRRGRLFSDSIPYSQDDYEVDSFMRLCTPLGIPLPQSPERYLKVPDGAQSSADALLAPLGSTPFVAMFPGASIDERKWSIERFRQVAAKMNENGLSVVVVGGGQDSSAGDRIVAGLHHAVNLAGMTSLTVTAAIIDRCALLISGDSGVLHIAVGLGKRTVSLFGPGRAKKWAPRGKNHIVLNKGVPCSPCTTFGNTPSCPLDAQCMKEIGVEDVVDAALVLLKA